MAQQMLLVVALVPKDLVTGLAEKLQLRLFFLHLLQRRRRTAGHPREVAFATAFTYRMHLHVFAKAHPSSEDPAALSACILPLTFVLDLMIIQQGLRGEEDAAELTVICQR